MRLGVDSRFTDTQSIRREKIVNLAVVVTVRVLLDFETTTRPDKVTLLPCLAVNDNVRRFIWR